MNDVAVNSVAALLAEAAALPGPEARRDGEVLLCHALGKPRSFLYAWPEFSVEAALAARYREALAQRRRGVPVAYLTGEREFWSLRLRVSDRVLIPRPDTERLVELALEQPLPAGSAVLDLGTGSGAIALALAAQRPHWQFTAVDRDPAALALARENGRRLSLTVRWLEGDWFAPLVDERFALVVANPPYLASDDPHLAEGDLRFEPRGALVPEGGALAALASIIEASPAYLLRDAVLLLEHGCEQGAAVRDLLQARGFAQVETWQDLAGHDRVSGGRWDAPPC